MGAWQEGSKDLHGILDMLAQAKVQTLGLARGRENTEWERAMILSCYRRTLSTVAARASLGCLLGWLARVGEGTVRLQGGGHGSNGRVRGWSRRGGPPGGPTFRAGGW